MDTRKTLSQQQALNLVREYKKVITPRFKSEPKVFLYGSYSKGCARPESDIDVAVIVPHVDGDWLLQSTNISLDAIRLNVLIEPVLMEENEDSILYDDVIRTGIAV
ncbi:MAG: nucleotidyltransferase domain-containing protein [Bacteroidaceae bacterium]|nr:nucleotidyltransferase domain-containing protein [Bacteroidaceae bacterium]MBR1520234.1 nucleotidyltransferase domain-containing protein [Bacteroidaceae bacterium]